MRRTTVAVLAMWFVAGCPKRDRVDPDAELRRHLSAMDRLWAARAGVGAEPLRNYVDALDAMYRRDPRVRWRMARWWVSQGLLAARPVAQRRAFAEGRREGQACAETLTGAMGPDPMTDRALCAGWGAQAWVRWLGVFGPSAGAVDDEAVHALLAQARRGGADDLADWSDALWTTAREGADPVAVQGLESAVIRAQRARDDFAWVRYLDLARLDAERAELVRPKGMPRPPEAAAQQQKP